MPRIKKPQIKQRELSERQQKRIAVIAIIFAVVFMALVVIFVGIPLVRFISEPERFRQWVEKYGFWGKVAFVGMEVIKQKPDSRVVLLAKDGVETDVRKYYHLDE